MKTKIAIILLAAVACNINGALLYLHYHDNAPVTWFNAEQERMNVEARKKVPPIKFGNMVMDNPLMITRTTFRLDMGGALYEFGLRQDGVVVARVVLEKAP